MAVGRRAVAIVARPGREGPEPRHREPGAPPCLAKMPRTHYPLRSCRATNSTSVVTAAHAGTYEVWSTLRLDDGSMLFYEKHGVFTGEAGILYVPHGLQSDAASIYGRDKHLGGPWYTFAG